MLTGPTTQAPAASYAEALRSCAELPDDLGRATFFMLATLIRPWELVSAARVADGHLHLPQIPYGCERSVPVGYFARRVVGQAPAPVLVALGVRAGAEVDYLARLQRASHAAIGASLERLWVTVLEALVGAATSSPERNAVFAYAGASSLGVDPGLLDAVPALIDAQVRAAGY